MKSEDSLAPYAVASVVVLFLGLFLFSNSYDLFSKTSIVGQATGEWQIIDSDEQSANPLTEPGYLRVVDPQGVIRQQNNDTCSQIQSPVKPSNIIDIVLEYAAVAPYYQIGTCRDRCSTVSTPDGELGSCDIEGEVLHQVERSDRRTCYDFDGNFQHPNSKDTFAMILGPNKPPEFSQDVCIDSNTLNESYCTSLGEIRGMLENCQGGCDDGRCLQVNETVPPDYAGQEFVNLTSSRGLLLGEGLNEVPEFLSKADLPNLLSDRHVLADGVGAVGYEQYISFPEGNTGIFLYTQDDDAPEAGFYFFIDDNREDPFFRYHGIFENPIDPRTLQGKRFVILSAALDITESSVDMLEGQIPSGPTVRLQDNSPVVVNGQPVNGTFVQFKRQSSSDNTELITIDFALEDSDGFDEVYLAEGDSYADPIVGAWTLQSASASTWETIEFESEYPKNGTIKFFNSDGRQVLLHLSADGDSIAGSNGQNPKERVFWGTKAPTAQDPEEEHQLYLEGEVCAGSTNALVDCDLARFLVVNEEKAHVIRFFGIDTGNRSDRAGEIDFYDVTYKRHYSDLPYTNENGPNDFNLGDAGTITLNLSESDGFVQFVSTMEKSGTYSDPYGPQFAGTGSFVRTRSGGYVVFLNNDTSNQVFDGIVFAEGNQTGAVEPYYFGGTEYNGRLLDGDVRGTTSVSDRVSNNLNLLFTAYFDDADDNQLEFNYGTVGDITRRTSASPTPGNYFSGSEGLSALWGQRKGRLGVNDTGYGEFDLDDTSGGNDWEVFVTRKGTIITKNDRDDDSISIEHHYDEVRASLLMQTLSVTVQACEDVSCPNGKVDKNGCLVCS